MTDDATLTILRRLFNSRGSITHAASLTGAERAALAHARALGWVTRNYVLTDAGRAGLRPQGSVSAHGANATGTKIVTDPAR